MNKLMPNEIVTDRYGRVRFWPTLFRYWPRFLPFWIVAVFIGATIYMLAR